MKKTIYDFARHCMKDKEFNRGGLPSREYEFFDALGLYYCIGEHGEIKSVSSDIEKFYEAMTTLYELNKKYGG